jgi:hypothetical protein
MISFVERFGPRRVRLGVALVATLCSCGQGKLVELPSTEPVGSDGWHAPDAGQRPGQAAINNASAEPNPEAQLVWDGGVRQDRRSGADAPPSGPGDARPTDANGTPPSLDLGPPRDVTRKKDASLQPNDDVPWDSSGSLEANRPSDTGIPADASLPRDTQPGLPDTGDAGTCDDYDARVGHVIEGPFGLRFARIEGGTFRLGEGALRGGVPVREVTLSHTYYIGLTEVTNAQYEHYNPSHFRKSSTNPADDHPVSFVKWHQAVEFCDWLTQCDSSSGRTYRLPTEAEWEWAARGGAAADIDVPNRCEANFYGAASASRCRPCPDGRCDTWDLANSPVGSLQPNVFGLYDMLGNVSEWVTTPRDASRSYRIHKGRSFHSGTELGMTPPDRQSYKTNEHGKKVGFRIVVVLR